MSDLSPRAFADGYRIAINPIQYLASDDGFLDRSKAPPLDEWLAELKSAGFPAAVITLPVGMSVEDYGHAFARAAMLPGPSYFGIPSPEAEVSLAQTLEEARRVGGRQAALGVHDVFIAVQMPPKIRPRVDKPAVGAMFDQARLDFVIEQIGRAAEALKAEGVMAALHPHVGTWIETESETRQTLDAISPATLNFGPDSGHLSWAGADVIGLFRSYRDRISVMHVKDIRLDVRDASIAAGNSYGQAALDGLWTEPGSGDLDIKAMLAELRPGFDGWIVAEVDRPTLPPYDSAVACASYLRALRRPRK